MLPDLTITTKESEWCTEGNKLAYSYTTDVAFTHKFEPCACTFTVSWAFSPWPSYISRKTIVLVLNKGLESIVTKLQRQARPRVNCSGPHIILYGLREQLAVYCVLKFSCSWKALKVSTEYVSISTYTKGCSCT